LIRLAYKKSRRRAISRISFADKTALTGRNIDRGDMDAGFRRGDTRFQSVEQNIEQSKASLSVSSFSLRDLLERGDLSEEVFYRLGRASKHFGARSRIRNDARLRSDLRALTDPKMPGHGRLAATNPWLRQAVASKLRLNWAPERAGTPSRVSAARPSGSLAHQSKPNCQIKSRLLQLLSAGLLWQISIG
jgi:hypothetical protein